MLYTKSPSLRSDKVEVDENILTLLSYLGSIGFSYEHWKIDWLTNKSLYNLLVSASSTGNVLLLCQLYYSM